MEFYNKVLQGVRLYGVLQQSTSRSMIVWSFTTKCHHQYTCEGQKHIMIFKHTLKLTHINMNLNVWNKNNTDSDNTSRVPDQNGVSQACYIEEMYLSGRKLSIHGHISLDK